MRSVLRIFGLQSGSPIPETDGLVDVVFGVVSHERHFHSNRRDPSAIPLGAMSGVHPVRLHGFGYRLGFAFG